MSEFEHKTTAFGDFQLEMLVADVESKFIAAEDALSDLRHAVRQLKAYRPPAQAVAVAPSSAQPEPKASVEVPVAEPPAAAPRDDAAVREKVAEAKAEGKPKLEEETIGVPFWSGPSKAEAEEPKLKIEDYGMDSTSEASWPVARAVEQKPAPSRLEPKARVVAEEPVEAEPEPADAPEADDEDARREEVARIVAQMRDSSDDDASSEEEASEDDVDAKRRDVARMVADLRGSVDVEAEIDADDAAASNGDDEDARREEVARMVAEMRSGMLDEEPEGAEESDDARRGDVASMVAKMRAELDTEGAPKDETDDSDAEVRDEVRRAVEAARNEMASGYKESKDDGEEEGEKKFSFPDWQSTHIEPSGPPVIVIKDTEGRVELARVYETLSKVDCDENAALLNYTPHSVTVGLNSKASVPEVEALTEAVRAVFSRDCKVDSDGVRVNVQIGKDLKGKDHAA